MAEMYPDNQELDIFGEKVQWPGVDSSGKFSNGSFQNPLEKPSFIPAETINLILDNLSELIKKLGGTPDNTSIDQLAKLFTIAATANTGIMRDASGRAKVAAPKADDDIARKAEVDSGKDDTLKSAKSYTDQKVQAEAQTRDKCDADTLSSAKKYMDELLIKIFQNGYIQWPGMPSPLKDTSLHFEGYSWYEVNYGGNFFRAKGRNAKAFSSRRLTKEQIKNEAYIFQADEQGDAIRDIRGVFGSDARYQPNLFSSKSVSKTGCFEATNEPTMSGAPSEATAAGNGNTAGWSNIKFRASRAVPAAEENRPRNLTFTIWILVKD